MVEIKVKDQGQDYRSRSDFSAKRRDQLKVLGLPSVTGLTQMSFVNIRSDLDYSQCWLRTYKYF